MTAQETTLGELGERIDRGFKAIADDISDLRNDIPTKEAVRTIVSEEMGPIHSELRLIRDELDDLSEKFANVSGFRKEIDHALERIVAIEKRLRDDKRIAA
jgi:hypothetical protein